MTTPAKQRGIIERVTHLKLTDSSGHSSSWKNMVWIMCQDDGSSCPFFSSKCGEVSSVCFELEELVIADPALVAAQSKLVQNQAIETFKKMLDLANHYIVTGERLSGFNHKHGICDNISECRPDGSNYDTMYRIKDNVIRRLPSYSGSYHYPVRGLVEFDYTTEQSAEHAWSQLEDRWMGEYGANRILQLTELLDHVTNKWDDNLTQKMTPAQQNGIFLLETVVQKIDNGSLWVMQYDDDTTRPYFIPLGNTGTNGRCDLDLRYIRIMPSSNVKRSVKSFVNHAKRVEKKRQELIDKKAKLEMEISKLTVDLGSIDYLLSQQHGVKRV